jgi:alcohol dehydrogenase
MNPRVEPKFAIEITTALVSASTIPMLLKLFTAGKLPTEEMITHGKRQAIHSRTISADDEAIDFKFKDIMKAYETFTRAAETGALKMNIEME